LCRNSGTKDGLAHREIDGNYDYESKKEHKQKGDFTLVLPGSEVSVI